jgi:hypothetical protein
VSFSANPNVDVHCPATHSTRTVRVPSEIVPSSALVGCPAHAHPPYIPRHIASAASNAPSASARIPRALSDPQQSVWCSTTTQSLVAVHARSKVGKRVSTPLEHTTSSQTSVPHDVQKSPPS